MQACINDKNVDIVVEYKNNKNLYIRVKDGKLHVTCNKLVSNEQILNVIKNNIKSLTKMYEKQSKRDDEDLFHYYLGNRYTVIYDNNFKNVKIEDDVILVKNEAMLNKFYKDECWRIFNNRIAECQKLFSNLPEFELRVRSMKTRWGVNNRQSKTITLNSELIKKNIALIDYVVIHELCHFLQPNHSVYFWQEVEKRYPSYKEAKKLLNN